MRLQLALLASAAVLSASAARDCLPERRLLRYYRTRPCFRSALPAVSRRNLGDLGACLQFARERGGFAVNFGPPQWRNATRAAKNCQVLGCPEVGNSTTLVFDPAFDYYSAYANSNLITNATCVKSLGLFALIDQKKNYIEAIQHCQDLGGDLADVSSEIRTNSLANLLLQSIEKWYKAAYVGLTDMDREGIFETPIGNLLQCSRFRAWSPGHPRPNHTKEDCVILDSDRTWRAVRCKTRLRFICELPTSAPLTPITDFKNEDCSIITNRQKKKQCLANNEFFQLFNASSRSDQCSLLTDFDLRN